MNIKELEAFEKEVHDNAVNHGWWTERQPIKQRFALIHSELSEALEAFRNHDQGHIGEELADVVIRILDFLGGMNAGKVKQDFSDESFPGQIGQLHYMVSEAMAWFPAKDAIRLELNQVISRVYGLAESEGFDLDEEVRVKHETNKARQYRHGGKAC